MVARPPDFFKINGLRTPQLRLLTAIHRNQPFTLA
jgi:hypothetical protein